MLVQTSVAIDDHETWVTGIGAAFGATRSQAGTLALSIDSIRSSIQSDEQSWRKWHIHFTRSRERLYNLRPRQGAHYQPTWEQVLAKLPLAVLGTRVKSVNSDSGGAGLDYSPRMLASGTPIPPQDIFVIVVGGSKLSRGLTLEGLCISYFTRWNPSPTEDTILQLSRWMGFRGPHLEFCRLFTTLGVYEHLRQMNENDRYLRFQLAELMAERRSPRDAALIFRTSPYARPTAKLGAGKLYDPKFSPYTVMIRRIETGGYSHRNEATALALSKEISRRQTRSVTTAQGTVRGILSENWSADEVANALDSFWFTNHNPDPAENPAREYYRPMDTDRPAGRVFDITEDPYQLAAYLRQWVAGDRRPQTKCPAFDVGVIFGGMRSGNAPFDFPLVNREIGSDGRIVGGWGGRSQHWAGDAFFDNPPSDKLLPGSALRLPGARGLLLMYVIHKDAAGRFGRGMRRSDHTPTCALAIPAGGPSIRAVTVVQA